MKRRWRAYCRFNNDFNRLWRRHQRESISLETLVCRVTSDLRQQVKANTIKAETVVKQIWQNVQSGTLCLHPDETRLLLLEAVDLMATYNIGDRPLFRSILTQLFSFSSMIDREIFFFEKARDVGVMAIGPCGIKGKFVYTLNNVAGWKIPNVEPWSRPSGPLAEYYLELPFRRTQVVAATHLMAELMYRIQDSDAVLELLRHGATPSCVYLWPVVVMLDMRFSLEIADSPVRHQAILESCEAKILRYFFRARSHVYLNSIQPRGIPGTHVPPGVDYEDVLLIPGQLTFLVPKDRYLNPASLQHICRLVIRRSLLDADSLPDGVYKLSLPFTIQSYVDLLSD